MGTVSITSGYRISQDVCKLHKDFVYRGSKFAQNSTQSKGGIYTLLIHVDANSRHKNVLIINTQLLSSAQSYAR